MHHLFIYFNLFIYISTSPTMCNLSPTTAPVTSTIPLRASSSTHFNSFIVLLPTSIKRLIGTRIIQTPSQLYGLPTISYSTNPWISSLIIPYWLLFFDVSLNFIRLLIYTTRIFPYWCSLIFIHLFVLDWPFPPVVNMNPSVSLLEGEESSFRKDSNTIRVFIFQHPTI